MGKKSFFYWGRRLFLFIIAALLIVWLIACIISAVLTFQTVREWSPFLLMFFGDGLIPLLLFTAALFFRSRVCAVGAVITLSFNIFLRIASIIIFYKTFMPLNYFSLKLLLTHTNSDALKAVFGNGFLWWMIPIGIAIVSAIAYLSVLTWRTAGKHPKKYRFLWIPVLIFTGLALAVNLSFASIQFHSNNDISTVTPLPRIVHGLIVECFYDIKTNKNFIPVPLSQRSKTVLEEKEIISTEKIDTKADKNSHFDKIIIIAIESLDYHYIRYNNPKMPMNITPNLDRYSKTYFSMNNYYAAAQPTSWGLTAMFLSRLDYERDKHIKPESLLAVAGKKGFHSYYFSSAPGYLGYNDKTYKILFQAETQFFKDDFSRKYNLKKENYWGLSDKTLYQSVYKELKADQNEKFIAVISTIDTHPPYHNTLSSEEKNIFQTNFLQSLHSTDRALGEFVEKIMQDPKLYNERTLIIITADHTATHGENYTKRSDFQPERIPLIFITPQQKIFEGINKNKYASSIDLAPTILKLIGAEKPVTFMGQNLFSNKNCAITAPNPSILIIHEPHKTVVVKLKSPEAANEEQNIYRDFYYSFYGK